MSWLESASNISRLDLGIAAVSLACATSSVVILYQRRKSGSKHIPPPPPGPRPLPIIGNLLDVPISRAWLKLSEWAMEYGEIVHVKVVGQDIIFLNSVRVANDLLEKRSSIYSDRPTLPLFNELMQMGSWNFGLMPYGNEWRKHRKMLAMKLGPSTIQSLYPVQEFVGTLLVERLLENPRDLDSHCKLHATQSVIMAIYGILIDSPKHSFVKTVDTVMSAVSNMLRPGAMLIDFFPMLKKVPEWAPGGFYQRIAKKCIKYSQKLLEDPFSASYEMVMNGRQTYSSYVGDFLSQNDDSDDEPARLVKNSAAVAYAAGYETSHAAVATFFLAMAMFPEVQRKAQAQLDSVVGTSRLPRMSDRKDMPYISAIAKEILRWHSAAPQSLPHMLREDDTYEGYHIPKGSIISVNTWWMAHNPQIYPEPEKFKPERYLDVNGQLDCAGIDPAKFAFGFGRRICPGLHYSESSLFITIAMVLYVLNVEPAKDENGEPIPLKLDPSPGVLSTPEPYSCNFVPRSEHAISLLREARTNASL